jgi:hypothetical protein
MPTPRIFNDLRGSVTLLVVAAVGIVAALAIGDALRSGRSSSAAGTAPTTTPAPTTDTALPPTLTSTPEVARSPNTCGAFRIAPSGDYPLLVVEVVAGDVTCHDARGVMKAHYVGLLRGSWICHGPEGRSGCEKPSGESVSAHFADTLDDPEWEMERIANRWARVFAARERSCFQMTQPLCERIGCERVGGIKIRNCTPRTTAYRRSFGKARVQEIAINGERVAARFSNGELIELVGVVGSRWLVHKVGGNAGRKVFE